MVVVLTIYLIKDFKKIKWGEQAIYFFGIVYILTNVGQIDLGLSLVYLTLAGSSKEQESWPGHYWQHKKSHGGGAGLSR